MISIATVSVQPTFAQESEFEARKYVNAEGDTLPYRLLLPSEFEEGKEYPVVLFLHGAGERGDDNEAQLKWGVAHFAEQEFRQDHPAIVIAPQSPEDEYWTNLNWREEGVRLSEEPRKPLAMAYELL
ncbi:MAG: phospholipase, partial [Balneolaceae bacterium]